MSKEIKKQVKRKRNKIISFRATEKEAGLLDRKVEISGLTKQDYIKLKRNFTRAHKA